MNSHENRRAKASGRPPGSCRVARRPGFTLIELLVVVAIMGIVMTISVPFMHSALGKRRGMNGAVRDIQEACKLARDWAILQHAPDELRIRPHEGVFEVGAATGGSVDADRSGSPDLNGGEWRAMANKPTPISAPTPVKGVGSFRVQLPEDVIIEGLGVNGEDWTDDAVARVQFYADGTSDAMSVVLYRAESSERRNIWLEVVTGLPDLETDPTKFKVR